MRLLIGVVVAVFASGAFAQCPPAGQTLASLQALKAAKWRVGEGPEAEVRQRLALDLLPCLESVDPVMRDEMAFDALQTWMRSRQLSVATIHAIRLRLIPNLFPPPDPGFRQSFSALVLAEVARVDRLQPFLNTEQRLELVQAAGTYLSRVRDYRGFDEKEGWRHGVAHAADLMLQLSLNPQLQRTQAEAMLGAIASQVMPESHFYQYGEPYRLMAPVFYLARRGWLNADDWDRWFAALTAKLPGKGPTTQVGLAARHNLGAFLSALYVAVRESGNAEVEQVLLPGLKKAIKQMG